jgi:plasmid stability protein
MSTTKERAADVRDHRSEMPASFWREVVDDLDRLAAIESAGGDVAEIEARHAERQAKIDDAARDAADGSRLAALCHGRSQEHDDRGILLTLLKRERAERQGLSEGVRLYQAAAASYQLKMPPPDIAIREWEQQHGHLVQGAGK